jgi:NADP-dependent 3-hydroxy acid dehydrogenase YdfG
MNLKLKDLSDQVIVITGASSGIGLVTARMAAKRGARVVLNARNLQALRQVTDEINEAGGEAIYVVGDVGQFHYVQNIADQAIRHFGGFDTWVNNAGLSMDQCWTSHCKISDVCLTRTTGAWSTARSSLANTCADAAAR